MKENIDYISFEKNILEKSKVATCLLTTTLTVLFNVIKFLENSENKKEVKNDPVSRRLYWLLFGVRLQTTSWC